MTRKIRQEDAIAAMRAANPASAAELREAIAEREISRAMRTAIAAGDSPSLPIPVGDRVANEFPGDAPAPSVRPRRRGAALALGAGLACIAALVALAVSTGLPGGGHGGPPFAAAAIEVAEANPRLLVTETGWSVTRADQLEADSGEITFSDGRHDLNIFWYPARLYGQYLRDRALVSTPVRSTLLGQTATTVDYGREEYATMLAPQGSVFLEIRARLGSRARYEAVLHSLRPVGVSAWLAAMPAGVVKPQDRTAAVDRALRGVQLPPGFDPAVLEREDAVLDRYQFDVRVASAVACGWVESWLAARRAGDGEAAGAAVKAMATASQWPLLRGREMRRGWAANVRWSAKQLAAGRLNTGPAGSLVRPDGSGYEIGPAWSIALGCKPHYRRPIAR